MIRSAANLFIIVVTVIPIDPAPAIAQARRLMRVAIYFTPPPGAPLTRLAAKWLGRDAFTGEPTRAPDAEIDGLTADPARYGFHATMKAPFRPAGACDLATLDARLAAFCRARAGVTIARAKLSRIGSFFALVPAHHQAELHALADAVVTEFDACRAPITEAEIARRRPERLGERQRHHLAQWGYPYVFEEFRFHMTLTGSVADDAAAGVEERLAARFAAIIGQPVVLDGLALFVEDAPGAPFRVQSRHVFNRAAEGQR